MIRSPASTIENCLLAVAVVAATTLGAAGPTQVRSTAPPLVAGYEVLRGSAAVEDRALGELLLGELDCLSCHPASGPSGRAVAERITTKPAPDLREIGRRATPGWIANFVDNPQAVKPGTTMPAVLAAYAPEERERLVEAITHFLLDQGGGMHGPGYETFRFRTTVERGRRLFHSVGCVACHAPESATRPTTPVVPLPDLAAKNSVSALAEFLREPDRVRHGARMPSLHLSSREATDMAVYLLRDQAPASPRRVGGFEFEYYRDYGDEDSDGFFTRPPPDFDTWEVAGTGRIARLSLRLPIETSWGNHGFRYSALLQVETPGEFVFELSSDSRSGSELLVDGDVVATKPRDSGRIVSGAVSLGRGDHPVSVTYYIRGDTEEPFLDVDVGGRGIEPGTPHGRLVAYEDVRLVPSSTTAFVVDPVQAEAGGLAFVETGCSSCHALPTAPTDVTARHPGRPLEEIASAAADGAWTHRGPGAPDFGLGSDQRAALGAALSALDELAGPRTASEQIDHTLATFNCYACHDRDTNGGTVGGPDDVRRPYFRVVGGLDLGNEGRYPPTLSGVGGRLTPESVHSILTEERLHVRRDFMHTRMPRFRGGPIAALPAALDAADAATGDLDEPAFSPAAVSDGRWLVGSSGLRCMTCHDVGADRAPGISTINLITVYGRVRPGWFERFLRNPGAVRPQTRMPSFWDGEEAIHQDVAGGTTSAQIDAIWSYLSLGASMPTPEGMNVTGALVLRPDDEALVFRTFMNEVGPRSIVVGFPQSVHVAFDANVIRLAKVWRGSFFDAGGTWQGRAGRFLDAHGTDVLAMPPGPALAFLSSPDEAWPQPILTDRDLGGSFQGYELDEQRGPTFRYRLQNIDIQEQPVPIVGAGGTNLVRRFTLARDTDVPDGAGRLYLLAGEGQIIRATDDGSFVVDEAVTISVTASRAPAPLVRSSQGVQQLLLPIDLESDFPISIEVHIAW